MLRYVLLLAAAVLSLSCASSGSTADETADSLGSAPDRHRVTIGVSGEGRVEIWFTSEMGMRRQMRYGANFKYEYLAESGDTASVTVRRQTAQEVEGRILMTVIVDSERTQRFMEPQDMGPVSVEVPIP